MIGVGDFAVVKAAGVFRAVWFRRIVRAVRIVEMQPEKKRTTRILFQPIDRTRDALAGAAVYESGIFFLESLRRKRIVIEVEAPRQSPAAVENEGADNCSGAVTCFLKSLRDRAELGPKRLAGEIPHAVLKRISSSEDHSVRRPRQRNLRERSFKNNAVVRERIQRRSPHRFCTIATDVIGAQRVDRD